MIFRHLETGLMLGVRRLERAKNYDSGVETYKVVERVDFVTDCGQQVLVEEDPAVFPFTKAWVATSEGMIAGVLT